MKTFTIGEALEFGWHKFRQHNGLLLQVMLSLFALQVVQEIVDRTLGDTLTGALASIALGILSLVMSVGFTQIGLRLAQGHKAQYHDLFPWNRMVWLFFLASLLAGLAAAPGLALVAWGIHSLRVSGPSALRVISIAAGAILALYPSLRLCLVRFVVVEGGRPFESIRASWDATEGHWWHILGFLLVLLGLNIVGALLVFVGLLVSVPVSVLAIAHVYLKLKAKA